MVSGTALLLILTMMLFALAFFRKRDELHGALHSARGQLIVFLVRVPLALLSAAFISVIVPSSSIAPLIGHGSGWMGIVVATGFGAIVPGGPILTFPLALVVWRAGAGEAQMIAFLTSWSVFAVHRLVSYELPMLGVRFVAIRLASAWMLPFIAGAIAVVLVAVFGFVVPPAR